MDLCMAQVRFEVFIVSRNVFGWLMCNSACMSVANPGWGGCRRNATGASRHDAGRCHGRGSSEQAAELEGQATRRQEVDEAAYSAAQLDRSPDPGRGCSTQMSPI